jgi:hypothetical protein
VFDQYGGQAQEKKEPQHVREGGDKDRPIWSNYGTGLV